jgi:hypothetical protein
MDMHPDHKRELFLKVMLSISNSYPALSSIKDYLYCLLFVKFLSFCPVEKRFQGGAAPTGALNGRPLNDRRLAEGEGYGNLIIVDTDRCLSSCSLIDSDPVRQAISAGGAE